MAYPGSHRSWYGSSRLLYVTQRSTTTSIGDVYLISAPLASDASNLAKVRTKYNISPINIILFIITIVTIIHELHNQCTDNLIITFMKLVPLILGGRANQGEGFSSFLKEKTFDKNHY